MKRTPWIAALLPLLIVVATARADELYFPGEQWESVKPADVGWNQDKLDKAIRFAMQRKSSGVVVSFRGRVLAERYQAVSRPSIRYRRMVHGDASAGGKIEDVASVQKSVVSFLTGLAIEKKLIKLDAPVHEYLGVGWSQATASQESAVTIRHLISMSSGLDDRLRFVVRPGVKWKYNTTAYSRTLLAISAAAKKSPNELTSEWLTTPIGMRESRWVKRKGIGSGPTNSYGFATSARDLARFGQLMLANGRWGDRRLLSDQAYLKAAVSTSQTMNPSYGYLWWLNGQKSVLRGQRLVRGQLLATAPNDMYAALGALGRKCYVVPSRQIVVTRLGASPDINGQPRFDAQFWRLLMAAAPQ